MEARDQLMELEGLRLIQKRTPSIEEAAELTTQERMRADGTVQCETLIPREMLVTSWPANTRKWEFNEIPHPSDLNGVQVCSDKRFVQYLGHLVLKAGMGEARVQKGTDGLNRVSQFRDTILGGIADIQTQAHPDDMAPLLKATALTPTLTLTRTTTITLTLTLNKTLKVRTIMQRDEQIFGIELYKFVLMCI